MVSGQSFGKQHAQSIFDLATMLNLSLKEQLPVLVRVLKTSPAPLASNLITLSTLVPFDTRIFEEKGWRR